eukprot:CAMPEP_0181179160 /NCGR_PEP_ID=MMETSP1096-20121128/6111_1 /TAXON_ID=156174 ORGANISM="Chrysochromulina ericina, Strain CCMP281" /NCGR_SAMPLE_ID=MMETSP1096 /ASSEMBLY_ACC=CAM_ASM_000453 /LENGTH=138 /DNA_ID=CAMNT_0023267489 /DNA_START=331 /DNA_END=746 /DNA_ORIENTATION=-
MALTHDEYSATAVQPAKDDCPYIPWVIEEGGYVADIVLSRCPMVDDLTPEQFESTRAPGWADCRPEAVDRLQNMVPQRDTATSVPRPGWFQGFSQGSLDAYRLKRIDGPGHVRLGEATSLENLSIAGDYGSRQKCLDK